MRETGIERPCVLHKRRLAISQTNRHRRRHRSRASERVGGRAAGVERRAPQFAASFCDGQSGERILHLWANDDKAKIGQTTHIFVHSHRPPGELGCHGNSSSPPIFWHYNSRGRFSTLPTGRSSSAIPAAHRGISGMRASEAGGGGKLIGPFRAKGSNAVAALTVADLETAP